MNDNFIKGFEKVALNRVMKEVLKKTNIKKGDKTYKALKRESKDMFTRTPLSAQLKATGPDVDMLKNREGIVKAMKEGKKYPHAPSDYTNKELLKDTFYRQRKR